MHVLNERKELSDTEGRTDPNYKNTFFDKIEILDVHILINNDFYFCNHDYLIKCLMLRLEFNLY